MHSAKSSDVTRVYLTYKHPSLSTSLLYRQVDNGDNSRCPTAQSRDLGDCGLHLSILPNRKLSWPSCTTYTDQDAGDRATMASSLWNCAAGPEHGQDVDQFEMECPWQDWMVHYGNPSISDRLVLLLDDPERVWH